MTKRETIQQWTDSHLTANLVEVSEVGVTKYELVWFDAIGVNEWTEDFPEYHLARKRFGQLLACLNKDGNGSFEWAHEEFLMGELGSVGFYELENKEYIDRMREGGYEVSTFNSGGGMILHETTAFDGQLTVWADTGEGYARIGFYPTDDIEAATPSMMLTFEDEEVLSAAHAVKVIDLIDVFSCVFAAQLYPRRMPKDDPLAESRADDEMAKIAEQQADAADRAPDFEGGRGF